MVGTVEQVCMHWRSLLEGDWHSISVDFHSFSLDSFWSCLVYNMYGRCKGCSETKDDHDHCCSVLLSDLMKRVQSCAACFCSSTFWRQVEWVKYYCSGPDVQYVGARNVSVVTCKVMSVRLHLGGNKMDISRNTLTLVENRQCDRDRICNIGIPTCSLHVLSFILWNIITNSLAKEHYFWQQSLTRFKHLFIVFIYMHLWFVFITLIFQSDMIRGERCFAAGGRKRLRSL